MNLTAPRSPLRRADLDPDPLRQFLVWFDEAVQAEVPQPEAMTLATAGRDGRPAARIVLLRGVDEDGLAFFSNYTSRKGRQLQENPAAALLFHWQPLGRQVRIEGRVERLEPAESDRYFANRPRGHRIGAHASPQSEVIPDRGFLEQRYHAADQGFRNREVPRPEYWGGYRLVPEVVEFWQEGEHRLHDRLRYRRDQGSSWLLERLAP